jgi:hypothetical protein
MPFACPNLLGLTRLWYSSSRYETVLSRQGGSPVYPDVLDRWPTGEASGPPRLSATPRSEKLEALIDEIPSVSPLYQQRRGSLEGSIGPCGANGVTWQSPRSAKSKFLSLSLSLSLSLANENGWIHAQLKLKPDTEYARKPADVPLEKLFENSKWAVYRFPP